MISMTGIPVTFNLLSHPTGHTGKQSPSSPLCLNIMSRFSMFVFRLPEQFRKLQPAHLRATHQVGHTINHDYRAVNAFDWSKEI
jgi:hypothetical protein